MLLFLSAAASAAPTDGLLAPLTARGTVAAYDVAVGVRTSGALRFVDPGLGRQGLVQRVDVDAHLWGPLAVGAWAGLSGWNAEDDPVSGGGGVSVRAFVDPEGGPWSGALTLGAHREFGGVAAATATLAAAVEVSPLRVAAQATVERRFTPDADAVDIMVPLAVDAGVGGGFRVGAAWVGQDLEDAWEEDEEEGGAASLVLATGGWEGERLLVSAAAGTGIRGEQVGFSGRARLGWRF